MNTMNPLEQLYAEREAFLKWDREVPPSLAEAIKEAEKSMLDSALEMFTGHLPSQIELPNIAKIVFAAEYSNGKLVSVGSSCSIDIADTFDSVKNITDEEESDDEPVDDNPGDEGGEGGRKRGPSIGFTVKFADGKVIKHTTARRTMIDALRYMGLERASKYRGEMFVGYPLIGKEQRPEEAGRTWQKNIDGWWVYVNMGNSRAVSCLNGVAKMLGIEMEIIMDDENPEQPSDSPATPAKLKGRRPLFSINGSEPLAKNRAVYETVCLFTKQFPDASFTDIEQMFPRTLQGSYGVVRSLEDIRQRGEKNKTESARWFLEPEEILTAADGIQFAVSNEWGPNFDDFKKYIFEQFGWSITEL